MITVPRDQLIPMLVAGYGDIIAAGLTKTEDRMKKVSFSHGYNEVEEQIVYNSNLVNLKKEHDLSKQTVAVNKSSSYFESLKDLNKKMEKEKIKPLKIFTVDGSLETVEILELGFIG